MRRKRRSLVVVSILAVLPVLVQAAARAAAGPIDLGLLPNDETSMVTAVSDYGHVGSDRDQ